MEIEGREGGRNLLASDGKHLPLFAIPLERIIPNKQMSATEFLFCAVVE